MRYVEFKKEEFDDIIYPSFAKSSSKDESELETAVRLVRKFKTVATPEEISYERLTDARNNGGRLIPSLKLNYDSQLFELEEDEWKMIKDRVKNAIPTISNVIAEELFDLLTRIRNAATEKAIEVVK